MNHAEEVRGVALPSRDETPVVMKPGEESFNLPAASSPPQRATILGLGATIGTVRGDQFDAIGGGQMGIEAIAVVGAIADQSRRELVEEGRLERGVDKGDFMRRSTGQVDGERKTMAVANRHDFAAFTAASRANGGAPFFAELKLASIKPSERSSLPRSRRSSASPCSTRSRMPVRCHA